MVPLVALQKSVYTSILRKELSRLLALASGTSNVQSLQNVVSHIHDMLQLSGIILRFSNYFVFEFHGLEQVLVIR